MSTDLCEIMNRNLSDKGIHHTYTRTYHELFKDMRLKKMKILEVGIGTLNESLHSNMTFLKKENIDIYKWDSYHFQNDKEYKPGASLRGWKEWFCNSDIIGADIDKDILFEEDRIKTYYVDQTSPESIITMWKNIGEKVDIIIDDGLHTHDANICLFKNSYEHLKKGGIYVIEDVNLEREKEMNIFYEFKEFFEEVYFLKLDCKTFSYDNNLIIFKNKKV